MWAHFLCFHTAFHICIYATVTGHGNDDISFLNIQQGPALNLQLHMITHQVTHKLNARKYF